LQGQGFQARAVGGRDADRKVEGRGEQRDQRDDEKKAAEAGALDGLAEVFAGHLDADAHLGQARAHAVADAVAEGLLAGGALGLGLCAAAGGLVG
jgi:hypothetical protein